LWETDGVESSVALVSRRGMAFSVNGKIDGHATFDAPTQVMSGLLGALLHKAPRSSLVIGLGTGSTAGWLGVVPGMEQVDVVELEPGVLEVARQCFEVNQDVLSNPRVHIHIGDAREVLLTTPKRYDLVFSEPSNPYRAGIASMFTREFYEAASDRLSGGGVFVQWIQAYEISSEAIRTVYSTLGSVFPYVESWRTHRDLLLVGTREPLPHDAAELGRRLAKEPYRSALANAWRGMGPEAFLARFVATPELAQAIRRAQDGVANTDDLNRLEFSFPRTVGRYNLFNMRDLRNFAQESQQDRPGLMSGDVDWGRVSEERRQLYMDAVQDWSGASAGEVSRFLAARDYGNGDLQGALEVWRSQKQEPRGPVELALLAEGLALAGDDAAVPYAESLREWQPAEADVVLGRLRLTQGRWSEATQALEAAFVRYRRDPWPRAEVMLRGMAAIKDLVARQPSLGRRLYAAIQQPFAARSLNEERALAAWELASTLGLRPECKMTLAFFEPWVPWHQNFLEGRLACYVANGDERWLRARQDLDTFRAQEPLRIDAGVAQVETGENRPSEGSSASTRLP